MNKIIQSVILFLLFCSCTPEQTTAPLLPINNAFARREVLLTRIVTPKEKDSIYTVEISCTPLFDGKGKILLRIASTNDGFFTIIDPISDTIQVDGGKAVYQIREFKKDSVSTNLWKLRLYGRDQYPLEGSVSLDSIYNEDSSRYFDVFSPEARLSSENGYEIHPYASSRFIYIEP